MVVPSDFATFFASAAAVAGALIGLLFVAISVNPSLDGPGTRVESDVRAGVAFSALINTLVISLFALIPGIDLGTTALVVGLVSVSSCVALGIFLAREGRPGPGRRHQVRLLVIQGLVFAYEAVVGVQLALDQRAHGYVSTLAVLTIVLFLVGIARAWQLIGARDSGLFREMLATFRAHDGPGGGGPAA
jgi:hypothetical protein